MKQSILFTVLSIMFLNLANAQTKINPAQELNIKEKNDSLDLAKESQHFTFYSTEGDFIVLDSLAKTLENNYSRITNHLGIQIDKKIKIKIFPTIQSFHNAINFHDAPDWYVGVTLNSDEIAMVSPLHPGSLHTYQSLMQVIVHEFTHIAVFYAHGEKFDGLHRWLNEGYAQFEAGQINDHVRRIVESSVLAKEPPTWTQLDTVTAIEFGNMNGYAFSVTIVEFLINTYGMEKLVLLIKEPENFETIYGLKENNLEKQWIQFLKHEDIGKN